MSSTSYGIVNLNNTTDIEFIREVQQEISGECSLPFELEPKSLKRIIERAAQWFYKKYEYSVEERYFLIKSSNFRAKEFQANKVIIVPECIFSVWGVYKDDAGDSLSSIDPDYSTEKFVYGSEGFGTSTGEGLMHYVAASYLLSQSKQILKHSITYNFNHSSRKLVFLGEIPSSNVVLQTYTKLPLQDLYQDELFFRYVVAKSMSQLSLILGAMDWKTIGETKIKPDVYEKRGKEVLKEIEEEIKGEEGGDWFMVSEF